MILGYDFVEERLFAFRDIATGLSEEDAKLLRNYRDQHALTLKLAKNNNKKAAEDYRKWIKDPKSHLKHSREYENTAKMLIKQGESDSNVQFFKDLSKGAKLQAEVLGGTEAAKELEKIPFYKTKGGKIIIAGAGAAGLAGLGYYGYKKYKNKKKDEEGESNNE
jgi:hypothetical protein